MKDRLTVAAVAIESHPGRLADNLAEIRAWTRKAAGAGAELVLFPELSLTGFMPNHPVGDHAQWLQQVLDGAWRSAQALTSPALDELAAISSETGAWLSAGLLENAGNTLYNTQVLVGAGKLQSFWRKMHIPMFEMQVYNGGGVPEVIDTPLGRIGGNICFDTLLPESTRLLGVQNCEIALFPFAADPPPGTAAGWSAWARPVLQARCAENGLYGIAVNYRGDVAYAGATQSFPGGACIVGPNGRVLAETAEPMLIAELTADALRQARASFEYTYRFRRPELYRRLAE